MNDQPSSSKSCLLDPDASAALLLRLAIGMLFFFAGLGKILAEGGFTSVADAIVKSFEGTWLPQALVIPYAYVLPFIELFLGAILIVGVATHLFMTLAGLLLISLAFGKMVQQDHATVASNLNYVLLAALGAWFAARDDRYSLGRLLHRK